MMICTRYAQDMHNVHMSIQQNTGKGLSAHSKRSWTPLVLDSRWYQGDLSDTKSASDLWAAQSQLNGWLLSLVAWGSERGNFVSDNECQCCDEQWQQVTDVVHGEMWGALRIMAGGRQWEQRVAGGAFNTVLWLRYIRPGNSLHQSHHIVSLHMPCATSCFHCSLHPHLLCPPWATHMPVSPPSSTALWSSFHALTTPSQELELALCCSKIRSWLCVTEVAPVPPYIECQWGSRPLGV